MTDILLLVLVIAAPGALFVGWLAFLAAAVENIDASRASDLDERTLLSPRPDLTRSLAGAFPR